MSPVQESQLASAVLMVRPANFGSNAETATSNTFQRPALADAEAQSLALLEFDTLAAALEGAGVRVELFEDTPQPVTPDAVFPNNWVSFHADGTVYLYPLQAQNRRWERRTDIIQALRGQRGYKIERVEDLSAAELEGRYLEGTGSLVLDRPQRVAYACLSPRTDAGMLQRWAERSGYRTEAFHARDAAGRAIYHTNVMLCVGDRFAVACLDSIGERSERERVRRRLEDGGHEVVAIDQDQLQAFAGNMLQLATKSGGSVLAMSARAERALTPEQRAALCRYTCIVASPVDTIEDCAGGSVRCMLAEIFLPHP
jgi:hypothetical protein